MKDCKIKIKPNWHYNPYKKREEKKREDPVIILQLILQLPTTTTTIEIGILQLFQFKKKTKKS